MSILTRFPHLFLLMSSHTATKLTYSQVDPRIKGKETKPYYLGKVTVSGGVTLWTPEVPSALSFEGLPFPCVPSRKPVAIWTEVFVKFIAAINVILQEYKQAVALLHYWSIHTSMPKTWNLLMWVKLKSIFSSRNCLGRTLSAMLLGTPQWTPLLWCPLSHLFACRQNQETACIILVSIWTYRSMPMFSSDLLYGRP